MVFFLFTAVFMFIMATGPGAPLRTDKITNVAFIIPPVNILGLQLAPIKGLLLVHYKELLNPRPIILLKKSKQDSLPLFGH